MNQTNAYEWSLRFEGSRYWKMNLCLPLLRSGLNLLHIPCLTESSEFLHCYTFTLPQCSAQKSQNCGTLSKIQFLNSASIRQNGTTYNANTLRSCTNTPKQNRDRCMKSRNMRPLSKRFEHKHVRQKHTRKEKIDQNFQLEGLVERNDYNSHWKWNNCNCILFRIHESTKLGVSNFIN